MQEILEDITFQFKKTKLYSVLLCNKFVGILIRSNKYISYIATSPVRAHIHTYKHIKIIIYINIINELSSVWERTI